MKHLLTNEEVDFLTESNYIEREYSDEALIDATKAWDFAKRHRHMINDINTIRLIHQELMIKLNHFIAGKYRSCQVYVGNTECLHPDLVIEELKKLCQTHPKTKDEIKEWHVKFEKIHPFEDGNGRTGRIIMNIHRLNARLPILIINEGKEQFEYYKWFQEDKGC